MALSSDNNGFNPVWNEECGGTINMPDLALINFTVMDKDVDKDDFIGSCVIPATALRQGYRNVPLYSMDGTRHGDFQYAYLFVRIEITPF